LESVARLRGSPTKNHTVGCAIDVTADVASSRDVDLDSRVYGS
jgi:hypothetical protein